MSRREKQDHRKELAPFYELEDHSMLQLEPPKHTRLRGLVLRAFTSRKVNSMAAEIETLCAQLIQNFPAIKLIYLTSMPIKSLSSLLLGFGRARGDERPTTKMV